MNTRTALRMIVGVSVLAVILVLSGCPMEEEGVTIEDRVNNLVSDLNSNYSQVYLNWHPDTTTRQAAADQSTLESKFPSSETYEVSSISANESQGTATAVINSTSLYTDETASFTMKKDGDDWFIDTLNFDGISLSTID